MARDARTFSFESTARTRADAATLFALLSDADRWSEWAGPFAPTSKWDRPGDTGPGGIGAVRRVGLGPIAVREQVVASEQDHLHAYRLLTRGPLRDYGGQVRLDPHEDGGTTVVWSGGFTELIPGTGPAVAAAMRATVRSLTRRLVRAAERRTA